MIAKDKSLKNRSQSSEISAFLDDARVMTQAKQQGSGRLLFAMDATYSREAAWDIACQIQSDMFLVTDKLGNLAIKLAFYGGYDTFKVSKWLSNSTQLHQHMTSVRCEGGKTQISRVLNYALTQSQSQSIDALVFVGDCMEEDADELSDLAGKLGLQGVPFFIFQEGNNAIARKTFRHMASLSKGAYCSFDCSSAAQLNALLCAVAVYASGGRKAYLDYTKSNNIAGLLE